MRQTTFQILTQDSVATYPDEMCFAFNPNFIEIESGWSSGVFTVIVEKISGSQSVASQSIKVSFYNGKCRIYLSRLFELMFDDPRNSRCVEVGVTVKKDTTTLFSFSTIVIWGNLAVGERFGNLGVYNRDHYKRGFERNLIWFKKFPFTVSLFRYSRDLDFFGRTDVGSYGTNPILRNTKVCIFEKIDKITSQLPTVTSGNVSLPFEVYYYALLKRFVVKKNDKFYDQWTGDDNGYFGNTDDYCDSDNDLKPRADVTYLLETNKGFARYRFMNDELVYCGMFTALGFEDIPPSQVFPTAQHSATIKYSVPDVTGETSVFDHTFDYTFFSAGNNVTFQAIVNLKICNYTAGYYLRWIDRHGNMQYFLFTKGETQYKNKLCSDSILQDEALNGMYFSNLMRTRHLDCTISKKCCAVNLPSDIFDYVVTIVTAPIVDLYCGKDETGTDIWLPVNIDSSTVKHSPKQVLNDLEFSFSLPDVNAQSL